MKNQNEKYPLELQMRLNEIEEITKAREQFYDQVDLDRAIKITKEAAVDEYLCALPEMFAQLEAFKNRLEEVNPEAYEALLEELQIF